MTNVSGQRVLFARATPPGAFSPLPLSGRLIRGEKAGPVFTKVLPRGARRSRPTCARAPGPPFRSKWRSIQARRSIMTFVPCIVLRYVRNGGRRALAQVDLARRAPRGNTLVNTGPAFSPRINLPRSFVRCHVFEPGGGRLSLDTLSGRLIRGEKAGPVFTKVLPRGRFRSTIPNLEMARPGGTWPTELPPPRVPDPFQIRFPRPRKA